jgi:lipopolysaccharide transport system permease protein
MNEIIYTPESRIRRPVELIKEMIRDLIGCRELSYRLFVRNIRIRYRQSLLGVMWALIPSLSTAVVFILAQNSRVISIGPTHLPYPVYVIFGVTLWQTFVEALNGPMLCMTTERAMISKQYVAPEGVLVAKVGELLFSFAIRASVLIGILLWFQISFQWTAVFFLPALFSLILLGTSIGLLMAILNVFFQDISKGLTILTTLWLFLTPVIYPQPRQGFFAVLVQFNPVTPLLVTLRELVTEEHFTQFPQFVTVSCLSVAGILLTWIIFRLSMPFMIERMS